MRKLAPLYAVSYEPRMVDGEPGFTYRVFTEGQLVAEGWARGERRFAEVEAHEAIDAREALRSLVRREP